MMLAVRRTRCSSEDRLPNRQSTSLSSCTWCGDSTLREFRDPTLRKLLALEALRWKPEEVEEEGLIEGLDRVSLLLLKERGSFSSLNEVAARLALGVGAAVSGSLTADMNCSAP